MTRTLSLVALGVMFLAVATAIAGAPVRLAEAPTAQRVGDQVKIRFALTAPADVEVSVLDKQGAVVRRLAAGLLGANPPSPFQKNSLKQELVWDGRDDDGRAALGDAARGPFKVRVAAGTSAEFAGMAFGSQPKPNDLTNVVGLAVGPDGRAYVLSERWRRAWWRHTAIHVFKGDGQYDKTIKPFPAGLPADRLGELTALRDQAGAPIPVVHRVLAVSYYPKEDLPQQMAVTPDGNIHFLTLKAGYYKDQGPEKWLASLAPDGGLAYAAYAGGEIKAETAAGDIYLAASSDGKAIFATGVERGPGESSENRPNVGAVYRIELPERNGATVFFGDPAKPGGGDKGLNDARGLATDGKGRLFVADRGNNRVVVLDEKTGALAGSWPVAAPTWVGVHRPSGSAYVVSGEELVKFVPAGDKLAFVEKARAKLPAVAERDKASARCSVALDSQAEPAILWAGLNRGGDALSRCEEKDGVFSPWAKAGYEPTRTYWNIATGYDGRTVACKVGHNTLRVLDEQTGQSRDLRLEDSGGQTYRLGPNNQIYGMDHWKYGTRRWDKDGKSLPYPETVANAELKGRLPCVPSGTTSWERDFDVDRAGNVYVKQRGKFYHGRMRVDKYDKDGKFVGTVLWVVSDGAHGPRVDNAGNLYIAESIKPVDQPFPEFFKGKLPDVPIDSKGNVEAQYRWMYGSIVKFAPAGGAVWFPIVGDTDGYGFDGEPTLPADQPKVKIDTAGGDRMVVRPGELQGAAWMHFGCSYLLDMHPGHNRRCHCTATEFDVDDYGRVFFTDQGRFRVVVLDAAGNELFAFGGYGNQDSVGPAISFNWFAGLGATDRHVYVADAGNHRVVRVAFKPAAEQTCPIE